MQPELALLIVLPILARPVVALMFRASGDPDGEVRKDLFPALEGAALILAVWIVAMTSGGVAILSSLLALWLLALAIFDLRTLVLPNALTLPLIPAGLMVAVYFSPQALGGHLIGAILGWGIFVSIGAFFARLRGRPGLGGGDAKLLAAAGAWLGWQAIPSVIVVAALAGLGLVGLQMISGRKVGRRTLVPFGPCLAFAFLGVWLHGPLVHL